jgi:TonB family protein
MAACASSRGATGASRFSDDPSLPAICRDSTVPHYAPIPTNYDGVRRAAAVSYPDVLGRSHTRVAFLWFDVRADGSTGEVTLWKSSGDRAADEVALQVGPQMRWRPAHCGDQTIRVRYGHPIAIG